MTYSYRIEKAIHAAAVLHKNQERKGKIPLPYVTHVFAVAWLLAEYTNEEDIIIAGLLHDTIEDTDYTFEELEEDFGRVVSEIVFSVTQSEDSTSHTYDSRVWKERQELYIVKLKKAQPAALMVAAADKIHNMRSVIDEYRNDRDRFERDFGGTLEERMALYQNISNILNSHLENDILIEFNTVFDEYKKFTHGE